MRASSGDPYSWPPSLYALIEAGERPTDQLAVCVAHRGAHPIYMGGCFAITPQRPRYAEPLQRCGEDGCSLALGTAHVHAPPIRVELDEERLAAAIVRASAALREARTATPPARPAAATSTPPPSTGSRTDLGSIPRLDG